MNDPGMVSMASGLQGFLGCSAVIHEDALLEFFANGTVRDGLVVSTVHVVTVEISEQLFAEMFELPVEGLTDLTDVPKDKIFYAKSIVSLTGEPVRTSGTKSQMKIHFRLLCDIMVKSISVGSFNAITVEKFAMVTAVVCEVKPIISSEVPRQRQYDGTLPPVSDLFKTFKKLLADVHLELAQFVITVKLLPVGARNFFRDIVVVEPASRLLRPTVTSRVWFQLCTVFTQFCLFHRINSVDVSDFVSSIALERTALRSVQMAGSPILVSPNSVSVASVLQMLDEPSSSESSSDDISMNFADQDTAATTSAPIPDFQEALHQLRASIEQLRERDDGGAKNKDTLLLHLHNFEKQVIARLDAQDRVLGALRRDSNDPRNLLSLELQSSHKQLGNQIVTTGLDVVDVRRVVREIHQELNARINSLDEQVAATRNDLLEFSAQAQQTINIITSQLSELVAYINRGGDNKKGESSSSRGPQPPPPPVDQIRGTCANVSTPDFAHIVEMAQRNITERVLDADRRENLLQAERDRERRRRELIGSKRRRRN
ncbi:pentatricopeptide repeat-containing protein chloroplastic [Dorcoceras hygrometricum]|uniref:Pentatricopeptide repeat-containing protein chloroplastic n=1 Tax=Dorcoceras hygrometricum TaxID=472368 RepID=A0A2Z7D2R7_9LAMI|nr:pentatricopeptide repeat-containing protein chloroplastic [Dorcoceras hygrometricum]